MARENLGYWMRTYLGMEVGSHHFDWSELLAEHSHLALLAARGHGKSAFWSYAYPLWKSWREPNTRGLLVSNTENQVASLMRILKNGKAFTDQDGHEWRMPPAAEIPILESIIPHGWERTWTTERIWFTNGSVFEAQTFGKSFRGAHVQWIVVDDPVKESSQYSAAERSKSKDFLHRTITKMLLPARDAQLTCVGTPMHGDDIHADLQRLHEAAERRGRQPGDWYQRSYPGHWKDPATGEDRYLWPRLRDAAWHRREHDANSLAYAQEIELKPVSDETSLFPPELFYRHPETMQSAMVMRPSLADIAARGWSVYIGVDLAISAEVGADYTVIVVIAVDDHQNRYLIDLIRLHGASYRQQVETIKEASARYGAGLVYVESNQMQVVFADAVRAESAAPVRAYRTGEEKHSLRRGVPSLRPLIENGKFRLPRGDEYSIEQSDILLSELRDFGFVDGKVQGIGNHDDTVMAAWICDQAIRGGLAWGFSGAGEDHEDAEVVEAREQEAKTVADLADVPQGGGVHDVLRSMVASDREAQRERVGGGAPRVNAAAVTWKHSSLIHPDGVLGVLRDAGKLPAARAEQVRAWNALSTDPPNLADCGQEFHDLYVDVGLDLARLILRDLLGF